MMIMRKLSKQELKIPHVEEIYACLAALGRASKAQEIQIRDLKKQLEGMRRYIKTMNLKINTITGCVDGDDKLDQNNVYFGEY